MSELSAFIAAANRDIPDARARADIVVRAPTLNRRAPIVNLSHATATARLVGTAASLLLLPDGTVDSRGNALHFLGLGFVQGYGEAVSALPEHPTLFSGSGAALAFRPATLEALNARLGLTGIFG